MVVKANRPPQNAGRYAHYLQAEAVEVDGEFRFRLHGAAARRMGVAGRVVSLGELQLLAAGFSPDGLTRLGRPNRHRRWGLELVFAVPSGVGKAAEVLDDRQFAAFRKAVEKAVHDAMRHLERHAAFTRVTAGGVKRREPLDLLYTLAVHAKNRNGELSPHVHVIVFTRGLKRGGGWAAVENRHFYDAQRAAKRVFNQALAYHLTRDLGLTVVRHKETIRVKGVDREWAKTTRREEIKREQKASGRTGAKAATHATLKTRKRKAKSARPDGSKADRSRTTTPTFADVRAKWKAAAHAAGRYAADLGRRAWGYCADAVQQARANRCYALGVKYCTLTTTRFGGHKVDEAAAFFATGRNIPPDKLAAAAERFRANPAKFGLTVEESNLGRPVYASTRVVSREQKLFADLAKLEGKKRCGLSDKQIAGGLCGGPADLNALLGVRRLGAKRGVVAGECPSQADPTLRLAVRTYRDVKRPVLAVGRTPDSARLMRSELDVKTYSAGELAEKLRPPSQWHCLKTALLHGRGNPHERLAQAERMRRSNLKLPKGCVVVTDLGRADAAELRVLVKAVRQARGKLIFTGPASADVRRGLDAHTAEQTRSGPTDHATHDHRRRTADRGGTTARTRGRRAGR
jgi:conjugative relaxase-like TrwC/TraI family protein